MRRNSQPKKKYSADKTEATVAPYLSVGVGPDNGGHEQPGHGKVVYGHPNPPEGATGDARRTTKPRGGQHRTHTQVMRWMRRENRERHGKTPTHIDTNGQQTPERAEWSMTVAKAWITWGRGTGALASHNQTSEYTTEPQRRLGGRGES